MNYADDNVTDFGQQIPSDQDHSDSSDASSANSSNGLNESYDIFANIFSTNLEDLLELTDDYTTCEETEEMISEAMNLPEEQRERRLEEIEQHVRFLKADEKRKKIMNEKNHRPFDDSNIGLCSVCLDDNFQIVHQYGVDTACDKCVDEIVKNQ